MHLHPRQECDNLLVMQTGENAPNRPDADVSTGQAAHLLGVDRSTIFRLIKRGELTAEEIELGERTFHRIALADLEDYQRKREAKILNAPINTLPREGHRRSQTPEEVAA